MDTVDANRFLPVPANQESVRLHSDRSEVVASWRAHHVQLLVSAHPQSRGAGSKQRAPRPLCAETQLL
jgi:hypothetical protein